MAYWRTLALNKALTQVGVKEDPPGSNRGPMVDQYRAADDLPDQAGVGYSWCLSFVQWCYLKVGHPLPNRTPSVGEFLADARKRGWAVPADKVLAGDIACFDWDDSDGPGHGDWPDHVGIVTGRSGNTFYTVEGNTAVGNDSNGGQVMRRTRSLANIEGFVRVPGEAPPPPPPEPVYRDEWRLTVTRKGAQVSETLQTFKSPPRNVSLEAKGDGYQLRYRPKGAMLWRTAATFKSPPDRMALRKYRVKV